MGKASDRRKKSRQRYLSHLEETDPKRHETEVAKRLESLEARIKQDVNTFVDAKGRWAGSIFRKIDSELEAYGHTVQDARSALTGICCKAVASVGGPKPYFRPKQVRW